MGPVLPKFKSNREIMITSAKIKQQAVEAKRRESYTDNALLTNLAAYLTHFNYSPYYAACVVSRPFSCVRAPFYSYQPGWVPPRVSGLIIIGILIILITNSISNELIK